MKIKYKVKYNSPVILSFVILCLVSTIAGLITNGYATEVFFSVYRGSIHGIVSGLRVITHVFGHVDLEHFISNAMFLLLLGPLLEEKYGSKTICKLIIFTAIITGIIHCILWNNTLLCGASGIVFAFIVLSSFTAFEDGEIPLTFIFIIILFLGNELYDAIIIRDNISNLSHILGGLVGAVIGYLYNVK